MVVFLSLLLIMLCPVPYSLNFTQQSIDRQWAIGHDAALQGLPPDVCTYYNAKVHEYGYYERQGWMAGYSQGLKEKEVK